MYRSFKLSFVSKFFTLPKAKIRVIKYDQKKQLNFYIDWPWHWTKIVNICLWHNVSVSLTFKSSFMKILQRMTEILSGHETQTQTLDLQMWPWPWAKMADPCLLHNDLVSWTSEQNLIKILQECGRYRTDTKHRFKHLTFKCDPASRADKWMEREKKIMCIMYTLPCIHVNFITASRYFVDR